MANVAIPHVSVEVQMGTRDVFYVCKMVNLMRIAKVNAYIMHIFGKIELLCIHAT